MHGNSNYHSNGHSLGGNDNKNRNRSHIHAPLFLSLVHNSYQQITCRNEYYNTLVIEVAFYGYWSIWLRPESMSLGESSINWSDHWKCVARCFCFCVRSEKYITIKIITMTIILYIRIRKKESFTCYWHFLYSCQSRVSWFGDCHGTYSYSSIAWFLASSWISSILINSYVIYGYEFASIFYL